MDNREGIQPDSIKPLATTAPEIPTEPEAPEDDGRFLTPGNMIILGMMIFLLVYLPYKFTFEEMWNIAKAALGLSFVIFIHELGHFLAAKWCDVHVTTFSIGFGPPIPGCWYQWGETTYKLAVLPLGGYVQMVGQVDGDEASDGNDDDPRSYRRKTVFQRMLIISAGVIMNAILAVVCFIYIFLGPGRESPAAVINFTDTNSPAFRDALPTGAEILKIGSAENPTFPELTQAVINSLAGRPLDVIYKLPGREPVEIKIEPRKGSSDQRPVIGVSPPPSTKFVARRDSQFGGPYIAGTPAAAGKFEFGDSIIAMTDPYDPAQQADYRPDRLSELPDDPRHPVKGHQKDYFEFAKRLDLLMGKDIVLRVRRTLVEENGKEKVEEHDIKVAPMFRVNLGVRMQMGGILSVRHGSPADKVVRVSDKNQEDKTLEADVITAVSVKDEKDKVVEYKDKTLDPERLPYQLRQWSDRLDVAKHKGKRTVTLELRRHRERGGADYENKKVELEWDSAWRFDRSMALSSNSGLAIPELGFAYQIKSRVVEVTKANSPLKVDDTIVNIRFDRGDFRKDITPLVALWRQIAGTGEESPTTETPFPWSKKDFEEGQWAYYSELLQMSIKYTKIFVRVKREGKLEEIEIPVSMDESMPITDRGWRLSSDMRRRKASGPLEAVEMGLIDTHNRMMEVFQNIRGMIMRRISFDQFGGPLTIAYGAYRFAGLDFADFVFFLGLISINLAVVNFLPIPVLDGGHMVFLIYEKIRGQPASEGVRIAATYVGLAMILLLMLFVLYLDVSRLFF